MDKGALERFDKALNAIFNLESAAHKGDDKARGKLFLFTSWAVKQTRPGRREDWERAWAKGTGKKWKALTEFSGRIRRMAEEIEGLSGSYYFDPARAIRSEIPLATYAKREFPILPMTLVNYASWLDAQVKSISRLMKRYYLRVPRSHSHFVLDVSAQVKFMTGEFHDPEVAELLNAADLVVNPGQKRPDKGFDAQTLADLRYRQKRRANRKR